MQRISVFLKTAPGLIVDLSKINRDSNSAGRKQHSAKSECGSSGRARIFYQPLEIGNSVNWLFVCNEMAQQTGDTASGRSAASFILALCQVEFLALLTLWPPSYSIGIFTHLKLRLADAIHNFKWVKIIQIYQNGGHQFWNLFDWNKFKADI